MHQMHNLCWKGNPSTRNLISNGPEMGHETLVYLREVKVGEGNKHEFKQNPLHRR